MDHGHPGVSKKFYHRTVRCDHELLDQAAGSVLSLEDQVADEVVIHDRLGLNGIQDKRSLFGAVSSQAFHSLDLETDLLFKTRDILDCRRYRPRPLEPVTHLLVHEFCLVADGSPIQVTVQGAPVLQDVVLHDYRLVVPARKERGNVLGKTVRDHGERLDPSIYRVPIVCRMPVGLGPFWDTHVDIGYGYPDVDIPPWHRFTVLQLVKVHGVIIVNG